MEEINEKPPSVGSNYITEYGHTKSSYSHDRDSIFISNTCGKGFHFAQHTDKNCLKQRPHRSH